MARAPLQVAEAAVSDVRRLSQAATADSLFQLAAMYSAGTVTGTPDHQEAAIYYRKSAFLGKIDAYFALCKEYMTLYRQSNQIEKDEISFELAYILGLDEVKNDRRTRDIINELNGMAKFNANVIDRGHSHETINVDYSNAMPDYTEIMEPTALVDKILLELFSRLAELGLPEGEREALVADRATILRRARQPKAAAAETVTRKPKPLSPTQKALPEPPPGLAWPTETYSNSPEAMRGGGGIVPYLERVWLPIMEASPGTVDLRTLRLIDPSAASGINNFARHGRTLPQHLDIPTKREVNDRALIEDPTILLRDHRMAQVVVNRMRRGVRLPPSPV